MVSKIRIFPPRELHAHIGEITFSGSQGAIITQDIILQAYFNQKILSFMTQLVFTRQGTLGLRVQGESRFWYLIKILLKVRITRRHWRWVDLFAKYLNSLAQIESYSFYGYTFAVVH